MARLPGFEAIEDPPKEDDGVLPSTSDEGSQKIAQFKPEDLNRYLMNKEAQDLLKSLGHLKLPSEYFEEDISTIDSVIDNVN